ncbi:MAG: tRNA lysidine(34) synthetase TilS [Erysipelotrichaceae bacterium]|nr:tRNA lysidine(34) synthetase TilS [Erysipelotrichaceae bacterium]
MTTDKFSLENNAHSTQANRSNNLFALANLNELLQQITPSLEHPFFIAAVSGGPDSMALLYYLEECQVDYAIAHVNYHHRPTASRDEEIVRQFAYTHQKDLWVLHPTFTQGNFQAWAREVRYDFFKQIAKIYTAQAVVLGHHLDDHLETWMMQKRRGSLPQTYGLQEISTYQDLLLLRPFLKIQKHELQNWCIDHHVQFGIDESNLDNDYLRNRIRHEFIEPASTEQKKRWLDELAADQEQLEQIRDHVQQCIEENDAQKILADPWNWVVLETLLFNKTKQHHSKKETLDLVDKLKNDSYQTIDEVAIQIIDNKIEIYAISWVPFYIDNLEQLQSLCASHYRYAYFELSPSGKKIQGFHVDPSDFPIIIRQSLPNDAILQRYGTKKINRLYIDRKIPRAKRMMYPVIIGQNGLFFASLAGCNPSHYVESQTLYMLELPV